MAAALVAAPDARASTVVNLTPVADATLISENGDRASGADDNVFVGKTVALNERRALLRFDLSAIPAGSTVTAATLTLTVTMANTSTGFSDSLYRLTNSWGEGTSLSGMCGGGGGGCGGPATPGSATWVYRFWNTTPWTAAGGDFVAASSATAIVGGLGAYNWTSAQLAADVQSWVHTPATNFGWILIAAPTETSSAKRFASRDFADPTQRPVLTITYDAPGADVPLPTSAYAALAVALLLSGIARTRRGTA